MEGRFEIIELGLSLQEHFQGQILAVLTISVLDKRLNLVRSQAGIENLPSTDSRYFLQTSQNCRNFHEESP